MIDIMMHFMRRRAPSIVRLAHYDAHRCAVYMQYGNTHEYIDTYGIEENDPCKQIRFTVPLDSVTFMYRTLRGTTCRFKVVDYSLIPPCTNQYTIDTRHILTLVLKHCFRC